MKHLYAALIVAGAATMALLALAFFYALMAVLVGTPLAFIATGLIIGVGFVALILDIVTERRT